MRAPLLFLPGLAVAALYALARPLFFDGHGVFGFGVYGFVVGGALAAWANRRYGEPKPNAWLALLLKPQTAQQKVLTFYAFFFFTAYGDIKFASAAFDYTLYDLWLAAGLAIFGFLVAWYSIRGLERAFFVVFFGVLPLHCLFAALLLLVLPRVEAWAQWNTAAAWAAVISVMYAALAAKFFVVRFRRGKGGGK